MRITHRSVLPLAHLAVLGALACSGRTVGSGQTADGPAGGATTDSGAGGGSSEGRSANAGSGGNGAPGSAGRAGAGSGASGTGGSGASGTGGTGTPGVELGERELVGSGTPTPGQTTSTKLDLLLVVDNSISMADKQELLSDAVPDLVGRVSDLGADVHVGVISSSIATLAPACDSVRGEESADNAHLIGTRPRAAGVGVPEGFVSWKPGADVAELQQKVQGLIEVTGELGCGFEMPQEAWYRFLVDPTPPAGFATVDCPGGGDCAVPIGVDEAILAQRAAFLRPDSAVIVLVLSDENDCSYREDGQYYYATRDIELPAASTVCRANPNDPCCYSCAFAPPDGCEPDPSCTDASGSFQRVPPEDDHPNLRCWDQKRRFGFDFLYPVDRYVTGLTAARLPTYGTGSEPNPLFASGASGRDPSLVFMLGIVGVPWQDIDSAVDEAGQPLGPGELRFQSPAELSQNGTWDVILGRPTASPPLLPTDVLMHETVAARTGLDGDGNALAPPTAAYLQNPINGHELANPYAEYLQYACIFPLLVPRDCVVAEAEGRGCDCIDPGAVDEARNPLCQAPDGSYGQIQRFAKAYPGTRHLQILQGLGDQAAVASVCSRNTTRTADPDYGYRPALDALWERLTAVIRP